MPNAPLKPCLTPRCPNRVTDGYCHKCSTAREQRRGSAHARGYTRRWSTVARHWLNEYPVCGDREAGRSAEHSQCWRERRVAHAHAVDHVIPHEGNADLFWDRSNWQSLCKPCHSRKTLDEIRAARATGAPAQGGGGSKSPQPSTPQTSRECRARVDVQKIRDRGVRSAGKADR